MDAVNLLETLTNSVSSLHESLAATARLMNFRLDKLEKFSKSSTLTKSFDSYLSEAPAAASPAPIVAVPPPPPARSTLGNGAKTNEAKKAADGQESGAPPLKRERRDAPTHFVSLAVTSPCLLSEISSLQKVILRNGSDSSAHSLGAQPDAHS